MSLRLVAALASNMTASRSFHLYKVFYPGKSRFLVMASVGFCVYKKPLSLDNG